MDSQIQITRLVVVRVGRGGLGAWHSRGKLLYKEWISAKVILYSRGNYIQYSMTNHNGKEYEKEYICITGSLCCIEKINPTLEINSLLLLFSHWVVSLCNIYIYIHIYIYTHTHLYCCWSVTKSCPTLLQPYELQSARLLHPWNFLGKNTGVSSHFLLLRIFPTQALNPCLLASCVEVDSLPLSHWGRPKPTVYINKIKNHNSTNNNLKLEPFSVSIAHGAQLYLLFWVKQQKVTQLLII